jgi:hypothetical protein
MFRGKAIRPLDFSHRGDFISERESSEVGPWAETAPGDLGQLPGLDRELPFWHVDFAKDF